MTKILAIAKEAATIFKPPPKLLVSEWADRERFLSSESSAEPGRWNTDRAPYQREIMDSAKDPEVFEIIMMTSAQVGKTEIVNNVIGYFSHHDPCPMLLVQPTLEMAESYSKDRLAPMIRDTPALAHIFGEDKSRSSGNTLRHKKFPGGQISLAGSNAPASLASRPVRLTLLDEVDRFPASSGAEGDPVSLAKKRSNTFFNRLNFMVSTPTIKGASRIELAFNQSDQRRFHVPCPGCETPFVMRLPDLKWEKKKPDTAHFVCESCGLVIEHNQKSTMLKKGRWIADKPEIKGIRGYHLNELYSPWKTWGEVATDFLKAKKSPETFKTFVNTSLGETWEIQGDAPEWKRLYDRRADYKSNVISAGVRFLTCAVDIQKNRIELEVRGWGANCESWSIDYRVFPGDTSSLETYKPLDEILRERWKHATGEDIGILRLAIDSGFQTQTVYKWAKKYPASKVMVIKGHDDLDRIFQMPTKAKIGSKSSIENVPVWRIGVSTTKRELYGWLKQEIPSDEEISQNGYPHGFIHFPQDYPEEYFRMLTAEVEDIKLIRGFPTYIWVKRYDRNEALDLAVYNRAVAASLGIDRSAAVPERLQTRSRIEANLDPAKPVRPKIVRKKSTFLD